MGVGPRTDLDLPPPARTGKRRTGQQRLEVGGEMTVGRAATAHSRPLEIAALALLVLVASLYLMSRFPDLGLVIERYNKF
jgi:hypothetical protein